MIRNQWYVVLESKDVPVHKPVGVTRLGEKLVFWRDGSGRVQAMADRCPHLSASLAQGKICDDRLVCPFHAFEFDQSGACRYIPALGKNGAPPKAMHTRTYPLYEAHGFIWLYWGTPKATPQPPQWFDIDESFSYSGYQDPWPVHYSRMAENQLDVMHLAHVHTDTIGRGHKVVVEGPVVRLQNDLMQIWVYNRQDTGDPPRRAGQIDPGARPPFLEFRFPNLWHNRISADLRIVAAFVPVDEENGRLIIRFYQRMVTLPVARELFNLAGVIGSRHIADQDKRVVSRQPRSATSLRNGELFLPGDLAILTFRRHRQALKELAEQSAESDQ